MTTPAPLLADEQDTEAYVSGDLLIPLRSERDVRLARLLNQAKRERESVRWWAAEVRMWRRRLRRVFTGWQVEEAHKARSKLGVYAAAWSETRKSIKELAHPYGGGEG